MSSRYQNILLADDDPDDQEFFISAVQTIDTAIRVSVANNGQEALRYLRQDLSVKPELIFADINMPRVDGISLLREVKKTPHLQDIPVIICSTLFDQPQLDKLVTLGAAYCLVKPTKLEKLRDELTYILSKEWPAWE